MNNFFGSKAFLYLALVGAGLGILLNFDLLPKPKSKEEKEDDEERKRISDDQNIWSTKYWKKYPSKAYTEQQAINLAKAIKSSFGIWNDDEAKIYGVFRTLKYKTNVSQVADEYAIMYGRDLLSDLQSYFNTSEMNAVYDILKLKPE